MKRRAAHCGVKYTVAAVVLEASAAGSQTMPDSDLDATFEQGRSLRAEHRDAEALELFAGLHATTGSPRALAQVALAEGALGRWVDAEAHLTAVLSGPGDAWTATHNDLLRAALATVQEHLGSLVVECATPGAEVLVAGAEAVQLPLTRPLRAVAGSTPVEVRAPGRPSLHRVVTVPVSGLARETFAFPSLITSTNALVAPPQPVAVRSSRRGWAIGAAIAAGVSVTAGTAFYIAGAGEVSAYNRDPSCPGIDSPVASSSACASHVDAAEALRGAAIGLWAGGAVFAGASVVLFATEPPRRVSALSCTPGLASVSCTLRF